MVHPDGSGLRTIKLQIDSRNAFAFEPDWAPDGSRLVFPMFRDGQEDLYTAAADGSDVVQITDTPDFENGPDWGRSAS
jgi:TolB protein